MTARSGQRFGQILQKKRAMEFVRVCFVHFRFIVYTFFSILFRRLYMTFNKFLIVFTAFTLFLTACSTEVPTPNTTANTNTTAPANTNNSAPNSNSAVITTSPTPAQTTNNADTIKPVVLAYYEALKTKNDEGYST
jgi:hypothetical protein